jgi:hypothetical protein
MTDPTQRRIFMLQLAGAGLALCAAPARSQADSALKEDAAEAKEHAYVEDAAKVDRKRFPDFKPTQTCGSCQLFDPKSKGSGGCGLFPGKLVKEPGWCDAWN